MGKNGTFSLGKVTDRGRSGKDNRLFLEAVLWIAVQAVHGVIYLLILVNGIPSLKDVNGILKLPSLISY